MARVTTFNTRGKCQLFPRLLTSRSVWASSNKTPGRLNIKCGLVTRLLLRQVSFIKPDIKQKGVDLRIGMDIACMAIRKSVHSVVLITGDSDMVPALKLARREGLRVYCVQMDTHHLTDELKIHSDRIITVSSAQ